MSRDLRNYDNVEYVYAISPIALAPFWDKGGREIDRSKQLSTIFAILSHRLDATDVNNYFVRAEGRWFLSWRDVERFPPFGAFV